MDALYEKIVRGDVLNSTEEDELFKRPDADELIKMGNVSGVNLSDVQDRFLSLPDSSEIIKLFILRDNVLNLHLENEIFNFPDAGEILKIYILKGNYLAPENHHKILELPNAKELFSLIVRFSSLESETYFHIKKKGWI